MLESTEPSRSCSCPEGDSDDPSSDFKLGLSLQLKIWGEAFCVSDCYLFTGSGSDTLLLSSFETRFAEDVLCSTLMLIGFGPSSEGRPSYLFMRITSTVLLRLLMECLSVGL